MPLFSEQFVTGIQLAVGATVFVYVDAARTTLAALLGPDNVPLQNPGTVAEDGALRAKSAGGIALPVYLNDGTYYLRVKHGCGSSWDLVAQVGNGGGTGTVRGFFSTASGIANVSGIGYVSNSINYLLFPTVTNFNGTIASTVNNMTVFTVPTGCSVCRIDFCASDGIANYASNVSENNFSIEIYKNGSLLLNSYRDLGQLTPIADDIPIVLDTGYIMTIPGDRYSISTAYFGQGFVQLNGHIRFNFTGF